MAMLRMQADMQHKRPFSGCYTAWDLNLDANGAVLPTDNVDRILRNRQYNSGTSPLSSDLNMFFYKDLLTQTMLKHEAEFRDQIHELHQLYWRQKELMDEMKRNDLYKHHHSLETLQPNHVLSPKSSNYVQIQTSTSTRLLHCQPPISEAKGSILPLHSYDGNRGHAGLDPTCIESSSRAPEFMESNFKRFGKKILDLELPADEYFDSEEDGFSEVKMAPEVTDILTNVLENIPQVRDGGDKELSLGGSGCNSVFSEGNFISSSISSKRKVMADLNIPFKLEEDIIHEFSDFQDPIIGHKETSLQDPFGKLNSNFQVQSEEVKLNSQIMKDPEAHLEILLLEEHKMRREHIPCNDKAGKGRDDDNDFVVEQSPGKYTKDFKYVRTIKSLDLNFALPSFSTNVAGSQYASHMHGAKEDIKDQAKDKRPAINLEFDHVPARGKELAKTELVVESEPYKKYPACVVIDLNCCLSMDESLLMPSHSIEMNLEPPASPENEECSPPRGESDETQLETPLLSSGQEDGDLQEELVTNAVEAIVSISSSEIQTCLDRTTCEPFKTSNSLYWFARVASSVVDDPGSEFGVNIGVKNSGDNEYLSDGIDYFEAMTLNLPEIKVEEESWCKSNGQKEEEPSAVLLKNQPKRGRTRRGRQQKDFQSEILPSLATLSRYAVTEDLQMLGGLMEAAGAQWESGSRRDAGRNGYTKRRRRSSARASNVIESTMNMLLKQQSGEGIRHRQRRLIEWGKITTRPRGPRCPSSKPRLILGQV